MKPGYYIDWTGDIMILYPNKTVDLYSRVDREFYNHTKENLDLLMEGSIFLGDL
jgi:hypothetical protein